MTRRALVAAVALTIAALGGCSDGDDDKGASSSTGASAEATGSPKTFAADYRATSETFEAEVDRLRDEGRKVVGQGEDALVTFYQSFAAATTKARDHYRSLRPPDDLAELHRRLVDLLDRQADLLDAVVKGARRDSTSLERDLQELGRLLNDWGQANREMSRRLTSTTT